MTFSILSLVGTFGSALYVSNINLSSEFDTNSIAIGLSEEPSRGQLLKSSKYNVWGTWPAGHIEEEDN